MGTKPRKSLTTVAAATAIVGAAPSSAYDDERSASCNRRRFARTSCRHLLEWAVASRGPRKSGTLKAGAPTGCVVLA